jgi:hypothetical protein
MHRTSASAGSYGDEVVLFDSPQRTSIPHQFRDLADKLTRSKPEKRQGASGIHEIKEHPFFAGIDWNALANGTLEAPFVPDTTIANVDSGEHDLMETFGQKVSQCLPLKKKTMKQKHTN